MILKEDKDGAVESVIIMFGFLGLKDKIMKYLVRTYENLYCKNCRV